MDAASVFARVKYPCFTLNSDLTIIDANEAARDIPAVPGMFAVRLTGSELTRLQQGIPVQKPWISQLHAMTTLHILPVDEGYIALLQPGAVSKADYIRAQERMMYDMQGMLATLPAAQFYMEHPDGEKMLDQATCQAYRVLRGINDHLWGLQLSSGYVPNNQLLDLNELLSVLCQAVNAMFTQEPVQYAGPDTAVYVCADRALLELVILHLLHNSITYAQELCEIQVSLQAQGGRAMVHVRDNGKGMKPQVAARAFDPYFSSDPYCDTLTLPGEGLGLYMVRQGVQCMGGECALESEFGVGTRVSFTLPLASRQISEVNIRLKSYLMDRLSCVNLVFARPDVLPNTDE